MSKTKAEIEVEKLTKEVEKLTEINNRLVSELDASNKALDAAKAHNEDLQAHYDYAKEAISVIGKTPQGEAYYRNMVNQAIVALTQLASMRMRDAGFDRAKLFEFPFVRSGE